MGLNRFCGFREPPEQPIRKKIPISRPQKRFLSDNCFIVRVVIYSERYFCGVKRPWLSFAVFKIGIIYFFRMKHFIAILPFLLFSLSCAYSQVVRTNEKDAPKFHKLMEALHSPEVQEQAKKLFADQAIPAW